MNIFKKLLLTSAIVLSCANASASPMQDSMLRDYQSFGTNIANTYKESSYPGWLHVAFSSESVRYRGRVMPAAQILQKRGFLVKTDDVYISLFATRAASTDKISTKYYGITAAACEIGAGIGYEYDEATKTAKQVDYVYPTVKLYHDALYAICVDIEIERRGNTPRENQQSF